MTLVAVAATVALAVVVREALVVGFMGVLLAVVFSFPTRLFARYIPRAAALLLTLLLVVGGIVGTVLLSVPALSKQAEDAAERAPAALARARSWFQNVTHRGDDGAETDAARGKPAATLEKIVTQAIPAALGAASLASTVVLVFILGAFFSYSPGSYGAALRSLVPRPQEPAFDEAWRRLGIGLSHWVGATLVNMTIMGSLTALGMLVIGVDAWPLLGVITFVGTAVPYVGAIASAVPGLLLGLAKSPVHLLYASFVYLGVHVVEGYILQPFVMKAAVELRPGFLLLWQLLMATVFGLIGFVIATPLLVCLKIVVGYVYVERRLGKPGPEF